jgi:hypothetical protein
MVVLFVFHFFKATNGQDSLAAPPQIIVYFWCQLLYLANNFEYSNHLNMLIVDQMVWTGADSAELASVTNTYIENDQVICRLKILN